MSRLNDTLYSGSDIMHDKLMMRNYTWPILSCLFLVSLCGRADAIEKANARTVNEARQLFLSPSAEYSTVPFWVWNDLLTEEQIRLTLNDLAGQNVKQAIIHPRPGLMTPYLSEAWFKSWDAALKEAERLGMKLWIYDENSYPSGFAGGLVPEAMPESRRCGLVSRQHKNPPKLSEETVGVFHLVDGKYVNITDTLRSNGNLPEGDYLEILIQQARAGAWFGGKYYVDLLKPGVTEKFLEVTMGAYESRYRENFGHRIPGVFTDEPHLTPAGVLHWTEDLEAQFTQRWGYSLIDQLPSLFLPVDDFKHVRHNYYQLLLELFIDRWAKPCYEYCKEHDLEFTGHYWEHGWPGASHGGDNMAMYAWHQRPAIDILMNQYNEGTNAQFGNVRAVKELSSVAGQLGLKRTLCEAYGAGGWDLRFEDMKRIGDWLSVLGVNTLNEHLSYITIRGARKRDHPQSFSYHEPWWQAYHVMEDYFSRLSAALSQGEEVNEILIIEPTSTVWMYQGMKEDLARIGDEFQMLITSMSKDQVEYDIGSEDIIARQGSVNGQKFVIGLRQYHTVILSPDTENLNSTTVRLLEQFLQHGGRVLCCGQAPVRVDGRQSEHGRNLAKSEHWQNISAETLLAKINRSAGGGFRIKRAEGDRGILFSQRRHFDDGQLLFLVNTSIESPGSGTIESTCLDVEHWNPQTGEITSYPFTAADGGIRMDFHLEPCGSLLLFLSGKSNGKLNRNAEPFTKKIKTIEAAGPLTARRVGPNVLTLDYVTVSAGGQQKNNMYFYKAGQFVFEQNGMARNPWDSAVQFRDEIIRKTFDTKSRFEAEYHFNIEQALPPALWIVIERPDLYEITCNDKPVIADKRSWWLDRSFGKLPIANAVKLGQNTVRIKASPFTIFHELEPAYVIGDFVLRQNDSGFSIVGGTSDMGTGSWSEQGCPFYAEGVSYSQQFDLTQPGATYMVELDSWYGSVAEVKVNGKSAGYIGYRPWQCEVTDFIRPGANIVEVIVTGTLKNTLGPHHAGDKLGSAWPSMFQQGPENGPPAGATYHRIDYGLFAPFALKQIIAEPVSRSAEDNGPMTNKLKYKIALMGCPSDPNVEWNHNNLLRLKEPRL